VAKVGWVSKLGGWSITDAGIEALNAFPDEKELNNALDRRYKEVDESRKQAYELLSPASQFIAATLELVA
jgi:5-methylcytosine-specific restriction enzyme B